MTKRIDEIRRMLNGAEALGFVKVELRTEDLHRCLRRIERLEEALRDTLALTAKCQDFWTNDDYNTLSEAHGTLDADDGEEG